MLVCCVFGFGDCFCGGVGVLGCLCGDVCWLGLCGYCVVDR